MGKSNRRTTDFWGQPIRDAKVGDRATFAVGGKWAYGLRQGTITEVIPTEMADGPSYLIRVKADPGSRGGVMRPEDIIRMPKEKPRGEAG